MYIKKRWIVIILMSIVTSVNYGMAPHIKEAIEKEQTHYLAACGTEDAPSEIQTINQDTLALYQEKGYLHKNTAILVKYMSSDMIETLRQDGCSTWNNAITNGRNLIHMTRQHNQLTQEEIESRLAHEQAHIVLEHNAYLNPHYHMANLHFFGLSVGCTALAPMWIPVTIAASVMRKKPLRFATGTAITLASGIALNSYLSQHCFERFDLPIESPNRIEYPFLHKTVEAECDIIAAFVLPQGGRAGRKLYTKLLAHNGNTSGINGDHPSTATRIWYHTKIEQWQNYWNKEKPEIK